MRPGRTRCVPTVRGRHEQNGLELLQEGFEGGEGALAFEAGLFTLVADGRAGKFGHDAPVRVHRREMLRVCLDEVVAERAEHTLTRWHGGGQAANLAMGVQAGHYADR